MEPDDKLCYCFHVTRRKIVNFLKRERPRYASQISECFGAGTGCGWCIPYLIALHREIVEEAEAADCSIAREDYESRRLEYHEQLRQGSRDRNRHRGAGVDEDGS